jgi:hypothetical protein
MSKKAIADAISDVTPVDLAPVMVPPAPPEPVRVSIPCQECKFWRKPWPKANVGECDVSRRFLASPIYTPGLASCEDAEL